MVLSGQQEISHAQYLFFRWHFCCVVCFGFLLTFSYRVVNRTLSHICGRLYLPMLKVGFFTLMKMIFWWLCADIFHCCSMAWFGLMVIHEWSHLQVFFEPSSKVLADCQMYSSSDSSLLHLYQYITPLFCLILPLSWLLPGYFSKFCFF